ncbi:hypothetical protein C0992_006015 [Termitomyces sp. T32_za158]|nr:hypothetical protein C0992_006015 [Termitomyces sp. T32_za158]
MSVTLTFNPEAEDKCPLAEVKVTKLKDCLMLNLGCMHDYTFQQWAIACKRYQKHTKKSDDEVVSFVADGMLEPHFVAWYHANQSCIDRMTLQEYLNELQRYALPQHWQQDVCNMILASHQENISFADWVVVIQDLNAHLSNMRSLYMLDDRALQAHFESHMQPDLQRKKDVSNLDCKNIIEWIASITEMDKGLANERAQTQALIDTNNAERAS